MSEKNENVAIAQLIRITGWSRTRLDALVHRGKVRRVGNCIQAEDAAKIISERAEYIGLAEYAAMHTTEVYNGKRSVEREKLLDHLEKASYYGVDVISPGQILTGTSRDRVYFRRDQIQILDSGLADFFFDFGISEEEKVDRLLDESDKTLTVKMLRDYIHAHLIGANITPAFTECVRLVLGVDKDVSDFNDKDIGHIIKETNVCATKDHIIGFLNYTRLKFGSDKV